MNSQDIHKKIQEFPKNSQDFENIKFPMSHLEAKNPFGLVKFVIYPLSFILF